MHTLLLASRTFYIYYSSITPEAKSRVYIYLSYIPSILRILAWLLSNKRVAEPTTFRKIEYFLPSLWTRGI